MFCFQVRALYRSVLIAVLFIVTVSAYGQERVQVKDRPVFTDRDLEKYTKASEEAIKSPEAEPLAQGRDSIDSAPQGKADQRKFRRYEVPYVAYEGSARRIIIPVTLNGSVTAPLLLDTGSPGMHISYGLAEKLDVLSSSEAKLMVPLAIGGKTTLAVLTIIDTVQVGGARDQFVPARVSQALSSVFEGIIGMDFLANYSVSVDTKKHVVVLEESPPRPDMPGGHDEMWWRSTFREFASMRKAWEEYRDYFYRVKDDSNKVREARSIADRQCQEADNLLNRLYRYATDHSVPMHWREY